MTDHTAEHYFDHADYAGFWVRFFAVCIDLLLFTPVYYGVSILFGQTALWVKEGISILLAFVLYAGFFASKLQATPGMYLLKFRICNTEGQRISWLQALLWLVTSTIGWAFCFAGVIYLQSRFDIFAIDDLRRSCQEQNIAMEDCAREIETMIDIPFESFRQICSASVALAGFLSLIWLLSIVLPKDKTGFHNLICRTRFVKGRV